MCLEHEAPTKENIEPMVNQVKNMTIMKPKVVQGIKVVNGNSDDPDDKENVFMILYKDPNTLAAKNRTIYLSRHGESCFNLYGKIGGDSRLSSQGLKYSRRLAEYFEGLNLADLKVWTSELTRTHQTACHVNAPKTAIPQLNEIESGDFDGMTYEGIAEKYPVDFALRDQDKLRYRYPDGESYVDVCRRLLDVLPAMNQSHNLLVISHQAVLRCVHAYLMKESMENVPYAKIPLHTVMKVTFNGRCNVIHSTFLNVECVDTHRVKPDNCGKERNIQDAIVTVPKHL